MLRSPIICLRTSRLQPSLKGAGFGSPPSSWARLVVPQFSLLGVTSKSLLDRMSGPDLPGEVEHLEEPSLGSIEPISLGAVRHPGRGHNAHIDAD